MAAMLNSIPPNCSFERSCAKRDKERGRKEESRRVLNPQKNHLSQNESFGTWQRISVLKRRPEGNYLFYHYVKHSV